MVLGPDSWIDVEQAKRHLNKSTLDQDGLNELEDFIRRAEQAVISRVGHVKQLAAPIEEHHRHDGGRYLRLERRPVFEVEEISAGGTELSPADLDEAAPSGWYIDDQRGALLRHTDRFPTGFLKVTYRPGWPAEEIPADLEQATLELLRHMWKTQRGSVGGRPSPRGDSPDQVAPAGMGYALPNRVEQLLHPYMQVPVA